MIWNSLKNHEPQVEMFRRAIRRNRLSHAYLFHGPGGIGKRLFARLLSQCLLCESITDEDLDACGTCGNCRKMMAATHPDFIELACPKGKAIFPIHLIAGDDNHRGRDGLCHNLAMKPATGNRKIAVVDDADKFNAEAANAFLKTLEEPPDYCLLILLAESPDSLLPTIRSRCQPVRFAGLTDAQVTELLQQLGWAETKTAAEQLASQSNGSLEVAKQLLDPNIAAVRAAVLAALERDDFHSVETADAVTKAVQACGDTPKQRKATGWAIRFGIDHYVRQLHNAGATAEELERRGEAIERFTAAARQIEQNVQVPLVIHALFDDAARLHRV